MLNNINIDKSKRLEQLKELKTFETQCHKSVSDILNRLDWDSSHLKESEEMVCCAFNNNHRMKEKVMSKHLSKCQLKAKGYDNQQIEQLAPSSAFYYQKYPHIKPVVIDKQIQEKILGIQIDVPLSHDQSRIELSSQQRLAIYDHVISLTKADSKCLDASDRGDQSLNIDLFDGLKKKAESSGHKERGLEMLAAQRDMKRRPQSYRAKNVHISAKSYSEILRNVIENHCQLLKTRLETKSDKNSTSVTSHKHKTDKHKVHKHKSHKHKSKHKSEHKSKDRDKRHKH